MGRHKKVRRMTEQKRIFCEHYWTGGDATAAATAAGYKGSPGAIRVTGCRLLAEKPVQEWLAARREEMAPPPIDVEEVVERLARMARASVADLYEVQAGGVVRLNLRLAKETGALDNVRDIKFRDDGSVSAIHMHDSQAALAKLALILGVQQRGAGSKTPTKATEEPSLAVSLDEARALRAAKRAAGDS